MAAVALNASQSAVGLTLSAGPLGRDASRPQEWQIRDAGKGRQLVKGTAGFADVKRKGAMLRREVKSWSREGVAERRRKQVHAQVYEEAPSSSESGFDDNISTARMVHFMKKGYGAYGGGATLEKAKLDLSSSSTKVTPEIEMGGGGTNSGNRNLNGGGGDGDDGGDDDDYTGGPEDDDGGDDNKFLRKVGIIELFDRKTIEAVLSEWYKTMADLPTGLRRAMEMGLVSSAQTVNFLSMNFRPTVARAVARAFPPSISRAFVGRMLGDPAFLQKLLAEQMITIGTGAYWEVKQRGSRLRDEWDLALANVATLSLCNALVVWTLSPTRSYVTTSRSEWQQFLEKLPSHAFDKNYPLRELNKVTRTCAFVYRAAELSLAGTVVGGAGGLLTNALKNRRRSKDGQPAQLSLPVPSAQTSAAAFGAFLGLSCNLRYQFLYGADRIIGQHLNSITLALACSGALRYLNVKLGESSRLAWLGMDGPVSTENVFAAAYKRPSLSTFSGAPKSAGELGQKIWQMVRGEGSTAEEGAAAVVPKRRKQKVRRKVAAA